MFMAKGCEIVNALTWRGPEHCRAPMSHPKARPYTKSSPQCSGRALLDALLQHVVPVPRRLKAVPQGTIPTQLGLQVAWLCCSYAQIHRMGKCTQVPSVHGCLCLLLALMPRDP